MHVEKFKACHNPKVCVKLERKKEKKKMPFCHRDGDSFRDILVFVLDSHLIKQGSGSIIASVEPVHSMDGDLCPIQEFLEVAKEICPKGNVAFCVMKPTLLGCSAPRSQGPR